MSVNGLPVLGFVGRSGSGKTTLLRRVVEILAGCGLQVGYLKHAHHTFDLDVPGKDSFEIRAAGAAQTLLASRERWALLVEQPLGGRDPDLDAMLGRFESDGLDLILVEGFKHASYPKIEVFRAACGQAPLFPADADILAIATDDPIEPAGGRAVLPLADPGAVADFVLARLGQATTSRRIGR